MAQKTVEGRCSVKLTGFEPVGEEETFYIVDDSEIDPLENKIGVSSPLAQLMIGKKVGDSFEYNPPGGRVELTIIDVESM